MKNHLQVEDKIERPVEELKERIEVKKFDQGNGMETEFKEMGFEPFYFDGERSYRKRLLYPFDGERDRLLVDSFHRLKSFWEENDHDHPLSFRGKSLDRLLFFDTETTGLSTGAGNVIFLIGYARLTEEGIEVTQHLLESPSDEAAFLSGFLEDFAEDDYLVSYNGKSFDWPQVKSRHAFIRKQLPKLPSFGHIDLLHSARRLWKHELPSCRLSIVEEHKLHIYRKHDIPGSMAPILYFDYLHDKDPLHLKGVIDHNDQDVRSLVYLYEEIARKLFFSKEVRSSSMEHFYIGDWFEKLSMYEWAETHYKKAIECSTQSFSQGYFRLGLLYKKMGEKKKAIDNLETSIDKSAFPPVEAWIELSKYAEHDEKNVAKALTYAKEAYSLLKKANRVTEKKKIKQVEDLNNRLKRLEMKKAKQMGG